MAREKAKEKNFDILHFVADNAGLSTFEAIEKAYNMGASEQESILDKIRNEIENVTPKAKFQTGKTSVDVQMMIPQEKVLQIIDKYSKEQKE